MKVLDLFSGIGGFSLGLERAGMETIAFCEIEEYPRKVLAKHWPDIPIYEDVRYVTKERLDADGIFPDVITGGFPCQDISLAGKQAGIGEGTRSGLWSECARILGEFRPRYAIFENVTALLSGERGEWFQQVLWDISEVGYDAEWHCIPASELGAHHHRDRVWLLVYPNSAQCERRGLSIGIQSKLTDINSRSDSRRTSIEMADTFSKRWPERRQRLGACKQMFTQARASGFWQTQSEVDRVANGIPRWVDRLKGLGNAVVPQIPEIIGRAIMEVENAQNRPTE